MPGIQKPHCTAPHSAKAYTYTSFSRSVRPSMVIIDLPSICETLPIQAFTFFPSMRIVQAPQAPALQPSFVPVKRRSSRR